MTLAADLAGVIADTLALLAAPDVGLADTVTITPAGGAPFDAYALDATDESGAYAPDRATETAQGRATVARRRLFVQPTTTAGDAWPAEPSPPSATATWDGQTVAVLGCTPVSPGAARLGYWLDVER